MLNGSFSFIVAKRILSALEQNGPTRKTNLATKSGLNYNACLKYIDMLKLLEWIDITHNKSTLISITTLGREINERLFQYPGLETTLVSTKENFVFEDNNMSLARENGPRLTTNTLEGTSKAVTKKGGKANVMLVDDEPDVLLTYRSFLSYKDYNVHGFQDAYSALQKVASTGSSYFDLIILDIRMSDINGLQLFQSLRIMTPSSKFLFISALDAAKELVTLLPNINKEQVLRKPVEKGYFVSKVETILMSG